MESEENLSGTEKWIELVLNDLGEATTTEIIEQVSMFNQDCADRIPMVLTQMRVEGKVTYKVVPNQSGERTNIVWKLTQSQTTEEIK
ncbi:MAG: hypothetical protein JSW11_14820 [Candidatus Heimdallarchaeota archaeon]|nr:MAG: hypothetical protein JSW11_14820 [Candidatus Heimdallarchaeota archaeon]